MGGREIKITIKKKSKMSQVFSEGLKEMAGWGVYRYK